MIEHMTQAEFKRAQLLDLGEYEFQVEVVKLARSLSWHHVHFRPSRTAKGWRTAVSGDGKGFCDLILFRERTLFVEVKSETGQMSKEQKQWRDWLIAAGQTWYLWRPSDIEDIVQVLTRRA